MDRKALKCFDEARPRRERRTRQSSIAVVCDGEGDPVPVAIGIRGKGTCEVLIPVHRFDPFALLALVERHGGTVH